LTTTRQTPSRLAMLWSHNSPRTEKNRTHNSICVRMVTCAQLCLCVCVCVCCREYYHYYYPTFLPDDTLIMDMEGRCLKSVKAAAKKASPVYMWAMILELRE
jgi:hypothetical protein